MSEKDFRNIERLGVLYAASIDERDYEKFAACFAQEGIWAVSAGDQKGRKMIADYAKSAVDHLAGTHHLATNFLIDIGDDSATMRSTFIATHLGTEEFQGQQFIVGGVYQDNVVRMDGEWLFLRREIIPSWARGDVAMLRLK